MPELTAKQRRLVDAVTRRRRTYFQKRASAQTALEAADEAVLAAYEAGVTQTHLSEVAGVTGRMWVSEAVKRARARREATSGAG